LNEFNGFAELPEGEIGLPGLTETANPSTLLPHQSPQHTECYADRRAQEVDLASASTRDILPPPCRCRVKLQNIIPLEELILLFDRWKIVQSDQRYL
jgi:hypothetical protein